MGSQNHPLPIPSTHPRHSLPDFSYEEPCHSLPDLWRGYRKHFKKDMAINSLVKFWEDFVGPFGFHPLDNMDDIPFVEWVRHESDNYNYHFHKNFVPVPYVGNIEEARILVLMTNPGYAPSNYEEEHPPSLLVREELKTLRGQRSGQWCLDSQLSRTNGYSYWEPVWKQIAIDLTKDLPEINMKKAYDLISRYVAIVQLIPYHSKDARLTKRVLELESVQQARQWIIRDALPTKDLIVVRRKRREWGLPESEKLVLDGVPRSKWLNRSEPERIRTALRDIIEIK